MDYRLNQLSAHFDWQHKPATKSDRHGCHRSMHHNIVEVDGQTVNLMTAVSLAMLAAFTAYAVDVLKKLKDMLSTATPGADAAPTALPSGEGKEDHTAPEEE